MKTIILLSLSFFASSIFNLSAHENTSVTSNTIIKSRSQADLDRDKSSKPKQILKFAGIKKGDKVLDFLGGNGYYSELIANLVGAKGKVLLHNNKAYIPFVGKSLTDREAAGGLDKVERLISESDDLQLGEKKFDTAILVLGYHDFFYSEHNWSFPVDVVMPQLLKSLKLGGKFLVIDHSAKVGAGISASKSLHRIEDNFVMQDLQKRGFKFIKESQILRNEMDTRETKVFDAKIRRQTDRFVYLFEKQ
ncbi:MAG: class I SAM-dependent methyltransferase [Colwellia sp.]|nr:class I SAM-dependent methyltransferase [Colwellia sp.]